MYTVHTDMSAQVGVGKTCLHMSEISKHWQMFETEDSRALRYTATSAGT